MADQNTEFRLNEKNVDQLISAWIAGQKRIMDVPEDFLIEVSDFKKLLMREGCSEEEAERFIESLEDNG